MAPYECVDASDDEVLVLRPSSFRNSSVNEDRSDDSCQSSVELDRAAAATPFTAAARSIDEDHYAPGMRCELIVEDGRYRARRAKMGHFALVAYRDRWAQSMGLPDALSVDIQSPILQQLLPKICGDGLDARGDVKTTIRSCDSSSAMLFHCWDKLLEILAETEDSTARSHIRLLVDFFTPQIEVASAALETCRQKMEISWKYLWTVIRPGTLVWCKRDMMEETIMKVTDIRVLSVSDKLNYDNEPCWHIEGTLVAFDGQEYGLYKTFMNVPYCGVINFGDSTLVPLEFHPDKSAVEARIKLRGRRLQGMSEQRVWDYLGRPEGTYVNPHHVTRDTVHERVLIHPGPVPNIVEDQSWAIKFSRLDPLDGQKRLGERRILSEEELLCTVPDVPVYMLNSKRQDIVFIKDLQSVDWDDQASKHFFLLKEMKFILYDIMSAHIVSNPTYEDAVIGKGTGIVVLLLGPPGSGKTSFVHALAQKYQKAVLEFTASGLEGCASEYKLRDLFELGASMQMPLLLDNICQWFKTAKEEKWMGQLTSALQRLIDRNRGIVFLTATDITTDFPQSLVSRIDLCVPVSKLDKTTSRAKVWKGHLSSIPETQKNISDAQLESLAKEKLNGKEITSIIKMARLLAKNDAEQSNMLTFSHLEKIMRVKCKKGNKACTVNRKPSGFGDCADLEAPRAEGAKECEANDTSQAKIPKAAKSQESTWDEWAKWGTMPQAKGVAEEETKDEVAARDIETTPQRNDEWGIWGYELKKGEQKSQESQKSTETQNAINQIIPTTDANSGHLTAATKNEDEAKPLADRQWDPWSFDTWKANNKTGNVATTEPTESKEEAIGTEDGPATPSCVDDVWANWGLGTKKSTNKFVTKASGQAAVGGSKKSKKVKATDPEDHTKTDMVEDDMWGFCLPPKKSKKKISSAKTLLQPQVEVNETSDAVAISKPNSKGESAITEKNVVAETLVHEADDPWASLLATKRSKKGKKTKKTDAEAQPTAVGLVQDALKSEQARNETDQGSVNLVQRAKSATEEAKGDTDIVRHTAGEGCIEPGNRIDDANTFQQPVGAVDNIDNWGFLSSLPKKATKASCSVDGNPATDPQPSTFTAMAATTEEIVTQVSSLDKGSNDQAQKDLGVNAVDGGATETASALAPAAATTITSQPTPLNQAINDVAAILERKVKLLRGVGDGEGEGNGDEAVTVLKSLKIQVAKARRRILDEKIDQEERQAAEEKQRMEEQ